jgi:hypothetical protein
MATLLGVCPVVDPSPEGPRMKQALRPRGLILSSAIALVCVVAGISSALATTPVSGAIFTTDSACNGTNINIYGDKADVYLNGGPARDGAAGLPDGYYYVQITEPNGTLLGTSVGTANETPVHVTNGEFDQCYQLFSILHKASDAGVPPLPTNGYDTTGNPGGEYKVWVSTDSSFTNSETKTDNFKVIEGDGPPPQGVLNVKKFYDANANGVDDDGQPIQGWEIHITDEIDYGFFYTNANGEVSTVVAPDRYIITESTPVESNWLHTTPNPVEKTVGDQSIESVEFGNVCTGAGGGLTLGFWSNKNGQRLVDSGDLAALTALNLKNANGSDYDPRSAGDLSKWLLNATATNMANMLSAQLAAMKLNVLNGFVQGNALIYAPDTNSGRPLGFATVDSVMIEANDELFLHPRALSGDSWRSYQEALKNALDKANNNLNFVQGRPCPFTFPV